MRRVSIWLFLFYTFAFSKKLLDRTNSFFTFFYKQYLNIVSFLSAIYFGPGSCTDFSWELPHILISCSPYSPWVSYSKSRSTLNKNPLTGSNTTLFASQLFIHTHKKFIDMVSPIFKRSKSSSTSDLDDPWNIDDIECYTYDIKDPILEEKADSFSPVYLNDLNSYKQYACLGQKDQKKILNNLNGFKEWLFVENFEITINPLDEWTPTYNKVRPHVNNILHSLKDNTVYKCLVVGVGDYAIKTSASCFFISKKTDPDTLAHHFITYCTGIHMKYLDDDFTTWKIALRKWLGKDDINVSFDSLIHQVEIENSKAGKLMNQKRHCLTHTEHDWLSDSTKKMCGFRVYDKITIGNYGNSIGNGWYKHPYFDLKVEHVNEAYVVSAYKGSVLSAKWIDRYTLSNTWTRDFKAWGLKVFYEGETYKHAEMKYKTSEWEATNPEMHYDNKIGSLDIETFTDNNGYGLAIPYAAGFRKITGEEELFYLNNNEDPTDMLSRLISRLLDPKNDGWLFYAHNLAKFDSRFILAALGRMGLKPRKLLGRGINKIFFISIRKKIGDKFVTVNLTDSIYILSSSLENLAKKFDTENKGKFPYRFVTQDNLYYKGKMPAYKFYNKLDKAEYEQLSFKYNKNNPWCMKKETLGYLSQDLICLINVMSTFNKSIFDKYKVNTTKVRSYSALSKLVYTTKYYGDTSIKIPVISGYIEKIIRKGYYGGLVDVVEHLVKNAYKYDANSHYPAAMLNDMPVGHPVISDEKDINKLFGFCHAKVTAPSVDILKHATLPFRTTSGVTSCPRGKFEGVWFSEELKDNIARGYKVEIVSSVVFKRGKGLFDNFINNLFSAKAKAKEQGDSVGELIYKLLMNSFYGKCGQLEVENTYTMVEKDKLEHFAKNHNFDLSQDFDKLTLVRENAKFEPGLQELLNHKDNSKRKRLQDKKRLPNKNSKGVKSSVGIAAAITAYARISLNRFKNIPGNKYLGGDTDSVIMQTPLPSKLVGKQLGMMKFEDDIKLGLFADKKLYYAVNRDGYENIKSRGVGKDFNRNDILKLPHFLLMLAGHVVTVNKTKFVITNKGAVEIKNVSLDTKIQKITYQHVVSELEGYLSNNNHKFLIARYISSLRNISDYQMNVLLNSDTKYLLNLLDIKGYPIDRVNKNEFSEPLIKQSLGLTIYKAKPLKLMVLYPRLTYSSLDKENLYYSDPPDIFKQAG